MADAPHGSDHAATTAPGGHAPGVNSKAVGLTMALLGVLLAFGAALVGGQRAELVKTLVEQTQAAGEAQALATKYRMLFSQVEQLGAIAPTNAQVHALHGELEALRARTPAEEAPVVDAAQTMGSGIAGMLQPTSQPLARLIGLVRKARHEAALARRWTAAYEPVVHARVTATEHFEVGQLCAEIGIVLSSIALLLSNRVAWYCAMLLGVASAVVVSTTVVSLRADLARTDVQVEHAREAYLAMAHGAETRADEVDTLHALEAGMSPENLRTAHPAGTASSAAEGP